MVLRLKNMIKKQRNELFEKILKSSNTEDIIKRRREHKEKLTLSFQLGLFVGEEICVKIPTLSCDMIQSNKVIKVTDEEQSEVNRLEGIWGDNYQINKNTEESNLLFKQYRKYVRTLEEKYYPKTITLYTRLLNIPETEMDEFKRGISLALRDCDFCSYDTKVENIEVKDGESLIFTEIILKYFGD